MSFLQVHRAPSSTCSALPAAVSGLTLTKNHLTSNNRFKDHGA